MQTINSNLQKLLPTSAVSDLIAEADKGTACKRIVLCHSVTLETPYKYGLTGQGASGIAYLNMTSSSFGTIMYVQSGATNIFLRAKSNSIWGGWVKL